MDQQELGERLDRIDAQLAGLVGAVAVLVAQAADAHGSTVLERIEAQLEGLHAALLADGGRYSEAALKGFQDLREALLPQGPQ